MIFNAICFTSLIMAWAWQGYSLALKNLGQIVLLNQAQEPLIRRTDDRMVGSRPVGQTYTLAEYFHFRAYANCDEAGNSVGSKDGPINQKLMEQIQTDAMAYQQVYVINQTITDDALATSAFDLDTSLSHLLAQANRVSKERQCYPNQLLKLILGHEGLFLFAEHRSVNVLQLNMGRWMPC